MLVGGGLPLFPQHGRQVDLELVETHTFTRVVYLRSRVTRQTAPQKPQPPPTSPPVMFFVVLQEGRWPSGPA